MELIKQLREYAGRSAGPVYATVVLKGWQVRRIAADVRAQESIRQDTERILRENGCRRV